MKYLLDTNVCIKYLNGRSENIVTQLKKTSPDSIALCSVVKSELLTGAYKSNVSQNVLRRLEIFFEKFNSIPFDDKAALYYGKTRSELEKKGIVIGPYDLQIAAITLAHDLTLVTHNTKEFTRISELKLADWELSA